MLGFFRNQLKKGISYVGNELIARSQLFVPWDYALLAVSLASPLVLKSNVLLTLLNISFTGATLLLPRGSNLSVPNVAVSPEHARILKIIKRVLNQAQDRQKIFTHPDHVLLVNMDSKMIGVNAMTSRQNKHILTFNGNTTQLSDEALAIIIEHELAHIHFKDTLATAYSERMLLSGILFVTFAMKEQFFSSLAWMAMLYLIKQAGSRYREQRADHYAVQSSADYKDVDQNKVNDLKEMLKVLNTLSTEDFVLDALQKDNNYLRQADLHILRSRNEPRTFLEHTTNIFLNLLSSHPTPQRRTNF